ncbi:hypothetical protein EYZ11_003981 [Aspergillus tanneri]|uniref:Uncharacterized protein n=1 Tax=Aspergillus tanneri TaxID=1220188 RepID=A0A4S3JP35_9EURO|nr:hypothetical protein EYZ11_003981 [Aspergillus tanneri]
MSLCIHLPPHLEHLIQVLTDLVCVEIEKPHQEHGCKAAHFPERPVYSADESKKLYAAFRLWSDDAPVAGLNTRANESYTFDQLDYLGSLHPQQGTNMSRR